MSHPGAAELGELLALCPALAQLRDDALCEQADWLEGARGHAALRGAGAVPRLPPGARRRGPRGARVGAGPVREIVTRLLRRFDPAGELLAV